MKCTGISISKESIRFLTEKGKKLGHDWELIESDLFDYNPGVKYDAIVIMGVIEHLPDYLRVVKKFQSLIKPGGRVFLDGSACIKKYELSSFMVKYIYPGNHSFLVLDDLLNKVAKTPFQVEEVFQRQNELLLHLHPVGEEPRRAQGFPGEEFRRVQLPPLPALSVGRVPTNS